MTYIFAVILVFASLSCEKSKSVFILIAIFVWSFFIFNYDNPDIRVYETIFNYQIDTEASEPIFLMLNHLFFRLGLSYKALYAFEGALAVGLMSGFIIRFVPYYALAMAMYIVFPLCVDVVQVRFYVAYSFALHGIGYILDYYNGKNSRVKSLILYLISLLIGAGFHYSVLAYMILVVSLLQPKKHRLLIYIILPICMIYCISHIDYLLPQISAIVGSHKADIWIGSAEGTTLKHMIRLLLMRGGYVVLVGLSWYIGPMRTRKIVIAKEGIAKIKDSTENVYSLNTTLILTVLMSYIFLYSFAEYSLGTEFERLSRLGIVLSVYIVIRNLDYMIPFDKHVMKIMLLMLMILYLVITLFFSHHLDMTWVDWVFRPVFEHNDLFLFK